MATLKSINPFTNELLVELQEYDDNKLEAILQCASETFDSWKNTSFSERGALMKKCAQQLMSDKNSLARLISVEMGKPILQAIAEIEKCALTCEYYAGHAEEFLKDEKILSDASESFICYQPLGTILAVMPWNFPFWQVFRFAAPSIMAGNVAILKHSSNVPQCAVAIEKIFMDAGFPKGVFQTVLVGSVKVEKLIGHPVIKATTLTGSEKAGSEVAMISGKNIKKSVLELGGSDPFIVLKDADLDHASDMAVKARMINAGQSCIAAKRFIIASEVYDEFLSKMQEHMMKLKMGDPLDEITDLGPLAREDLAVGLLAQVNKSVQQGAKKYWGGGRPSMKGAFVNPVMLTEVTPGMPAYEEEFFGPVAILFKTENEQEAIRLANDSNFGLGGSVWTKDTERGLSVARQVEAGALFINGIVKSDPRLPFGGIKNSGYGRELSYFGIREFVNIKSVWVR